MRARTLVFALALLAPATLSAQRIPIRIGGRGPARPQPLPPQPRPIAQDLAYRRSHLAIESYPLVSFTSAPGLIGPGRAGSWASIGAGTRADYRINRFMSGTLDLTSSFLGGPAITQTAEVGTRFHRERGESRWYPFVDFRVGYIASYRNFGTIGDVYVDPVTQGRYAGYGHGFGLVEGAGLEYGLTRTLSLTTSASLLQSRLHMDPLESPNGAPRHFGLTSLRYTLGIRFNPVYVVRGGDTRAKAR